ncbi:MAG: GDSL-type esterase/lipase family protein [Verrucomicrobiota bacterium]
MTPHIRRFLAILIFLLGHCTPPLLAAPGEHDFAVWEKEMSAFERADEVKRPPQGAVLFIGSSTIRMWASLAQDFASVPVINRGFGGSEIMDATHFAPRVIFPYAPRAIYLRAGGNDLWRGREVEAVFADFKDFVGSVHAKLPATDIIFISLSPSPSRWQQKDRERALNQLIATFIQGKPHLRYIETFDLPLGPDGQPRPELFLADKLHFNVEGYKLLAAKVRPDLSR